MRTYLDWRTKWPGYLLAIAVGAVNSAWAQDDTALTKEFLNEAPKHWRKYGEFLGRLQGGAKVNIVRDGKSRYAFASTIKQNAQCKLALEQFSALSDRPKDSNAGFVRVVNANYSFSLRRETIEKPWVLLEYRPPAKDKKTYAPIETGNLRPLLAILMSIGPTDLADLIQEPTFRILRAENVNHLGREGVRIEFDNTHSIETKGKFVPIQKGEMILDPSRSWCLEAWRIKTKYNNAEPDERMEATYRDSKDNYPIPVRVVVKSERMEAAKVLHGQDDYDYELEDPARPPGDDEFTMSAFGFPEPMGMPPVNRGIRWYIWLVLAAFASVAIALLFRVLKQRFQAAEPVRK